MLRWRGRALCPPDQVANANDSTVNLAPVSEAPAVQVHANWDVLLPGKEVPLIWERTYDDAEPCGDL